MISEVDDSLINVDYSHTSIERLNILGGSELSLQLAPHLVMDRHDGFDLPIT
jgi:hypothetical protein